MKITPAHEALRLPSAKLTADQEKTVDKITYEINDGIQKGFKRNGFEYTTSCSDPVVVFEVVQLLQDAGYLVEVRPQARPSRFEQGKMEIVGFILNCAPGREAVEAARRTIQ